MTSIKKVFRTYTAGAGSLEVSSLGEGLEGLSYSSLRKIGLRSHSG